MHPITWIRYCCTLVSPGLAKVSPGLPNETVSLVMLTIPPQAAFTEKGYMSLDAVL